MPEIGKRIKSRREELGITQEELASRLGYKSKTTIAKIESGVNDIVQSKVVSFADALDTTISYLMGWTEDANKPSLKDNPYAISDETCEIAHDMEYNAPIILEVYNSKDRQKLIDYATTLKAARQFKEHTDVLAAHARTDIKQTPEGVQHDIDIMDDDSMWD